MTIHDHRLTYPIRNNTRKHARRLTYPGRYNIRASMIHDRRLTYPGCNNIRASMIDNANQYSTSGFQDNLSQRSIPHPAHYPTLRHQKHNINPMFNYDVLNKSFYIVDCIQCHLGFLLLTRRSKSEKDKCIIRARIFRNTFPIFPPSNPCTKSELDNELDHTAKHKLRISTISAQSKPPNPSISYPGKYRASTSICPAADAIIPGLRIPEFNIEELSPKLSKLDYLIINILISKYYHEISTRGRNATSRPYTARRYLKISPRNIACIDSLFFEFTPFFLRLSTSLYIEALPSTQTSWSSGSPESHPVSETVQRARHHVIETFWRPLDRMDYFDHLSLIFFLTPLLGGGLWMWALVEPSNIPKIHGRIGLGTSANVRRGVVVDVGDEEVKMRPLDMGPEKDEDKIQSLPFDYCVLATGAKYATPIRAAGPEEWTCEDREKVLRRNAKEIADADRISVVGSGIVGVELAADILDKYPDKKVKILSITGTLLTELPEKCHEYAYDWFSRRGVEFDLNTTLSLREIKEDPNSLVMLAIGNEFDNSAFASLLGLHPKSMVKTAYMADLDGDFVARKIKSLICEQPGAVLGYPSEMTGLPTAPPLVSCVSLGKSDGLIIFNDWVVPGFLASIVKWSIMESKIAQMKGNGLSDLGWRFIEWLSFALNKIDKTRKHVVSGQHGEEAAPAGAPRR
ncbi:hypothetical protein AAMO2058_000777500 [Amorphochlora amoebiformis]